MQPHTVRAITAPVHQSGPKQAPCSPLREPVGSISENNLIRCGVGTPDFYPFTLVISPAMMTRKMAVALVPVPAWQKVVNHRTQATNDECTPTQWHTKHTMYQSAKKEKKLPTHTYERTPGVDPGAARQHRTNFSCMFGGHAWKAPCSRTKHHCLGFPSQNWRRVGCRPVWYEVARDCGHPHPWLVSYNQGDHPPWNCLNLYIFFGQNVLVFPGSKGRTLVHFFDQKVIDFGNVSKFECRQKARFSTLFHGVCTCEVFVVSVNSDFVTNHTYSANICRIFLRVRHTAFPTTKISHSPLWMNVSIICPSLFQTSRLSKQ